MMEKRNLIDEVVKVSDEEAVEDDSSTVERRGIVRRSIVGPLMCSSRQGRPNAWERTECRHILPDSGDRYLTEQHYVT